EEANRHRQLLFRLHEVQTNGRLGAVGWSSRRIAADGCLLSRAPRPLRRPSAGHGGKRSVIRFLNLALTDDAPVVQAAIARVVERGWFVLGPELQAFELEFASATGAAHAIGVGTGTDAIALGLRALGIGPGDEVITSPLSAAYSALAIMMAGARPVFADIDPE